MQYEKIRDKEILELTIEAGFNQDALGVPRSIPDDKFEGFQVQDWMDAIIQHRKENYLSQDPIFIGIGVKMEELGKAVNSNMSMISRPSWVRTFHKLLKKIYNGVKQNSCYIFL